MENRITFDFEFHNLTDFYLGSSANSWKAACFSPRELRRATKKARAEQLYITTKDGEKPTVVWKRYGVDPTMFLVEEVEETIVTTRPKLGGTRTVVKLVGEGNELLEIFSLQKPEMFVDTLEEMRGGGGGGGQVVGGNPTSNASHPVQADKLAHTTMRITARDPSVSEPSPNNAGISHRLIRGQGGNKGSPPMADPASTARGLKKQGSIAGEPYSNPLYAHGKIRYHMILSEAVPPHLFYSRPEVEALTTNSPTRPMQHLLQEAEQQRQQQENEDMWLSPKPWELNTGLNQNGLVDGSSSFARRESQQGSRLQQAEEHSNKLSGVPVADLHRSRSQRPLQEQQGQQESGQMERRRSGQIERLRSGSLATGSADPTTLARYNSCGHDSQSVQSLMASSNNNVAAATAPGGLQHGGQHLPSVSTGTTENAMPDNERKAKKKSGFFGQLMKAPKASGSLSKNGLKQHTFACGVHVQQHR